MPDVVCVADVHEGIGFGFLMDPETGVSARALDLHRNFVAAANWAIEHGAKLFCVLGDLFDRTNVAPVFRELVRRDVIEPLGKAGVEGWLLAGDPGQPPRGKASTSAEGFCGAPPLPRFPVPGAARKGVRGPRVR